MSSRLLNDAAESDAAMDSGMLFQSAIVRGTKEDLNLVVLVHGFFNFFLLVSIPRGGLCESFKSKPSYVNHPYRRHGCNGH